MLIHGSCHCGNISFELAWEPDPVEIPARACGCSFCVKHGGVWTSNPSAALRVRVFMAFCYLFIGWMVERRSRVPDSKVKAFFRILCSPVTGPVSRLVRPETSHERVMLVSLGVLGAVWVALYALDAALRAG